jgi:hypothetical protein
VNGYCWFAPASIGDDMLGVWAANDRDVWVVGNAGSMIHYDGASWSYQKVATGTLAAVWGSGSSSVWAVGAAGTVIHYDGATWAPVAGAPTGNWTTIAATSDSDLWILGGTDAAHFDGTAWTTQKLGKTALDAKRVGSALWVLAGGSLLRIASPGALATESNVPGLKSGGTFWCLVARSETDAWVLGTNGSAAHFDGTTWQARDIGTSDIRYAAALPSGEILGVAGGTVLRLGTKWDSAAHVTGNPYVTESLKHAYATAEGHYWAVGSGGAVAFYDGAKWFESGGRISTHVASLHGTGADDVWFAGTFDPAHWRGSGNWIMPSASVTFPSDVFAVAKDEAWVISGVFHDTLNTSKGWGNLRFDKEKFNDLSATAPDDVWAVGTVLQHYDGTAWTALTAPAAGPWNTVWQSSRTDVWIGSDAGVYRGDGTTWTLVETGATGRVNMLRGTSASDVWGVWDTGIRHFDGTTWQARTPPAGFKVGGLATGGSDDAWLWGMPGRVAHYQGGAWTEIDLPTSQSTSSVWVNGTDVWIGGASGALLRKM